MSVVLLLSSCSSENNSNKANYGNNVNILVPDGVPLLPMIGFGMGTDSEAKDGVFEFSGEISDLLGAKTSINIVQGSDQLAAKITQSKPEILVAPINLIAKLNQNSDDDKTSYKLAGITTWGMNSIVSNTNINSINDLKGKKLYTFGKSEVPGIVLRSILAKSEINYVENATDTPDSETVDLVEFSTASDIVQQLTKDSATSEVFGMLPEPTSSVFTSKMGEKFKINLNLQEVWKAQNDGKNYPMAGIAFRSDFINADVNTNYISEFLISLELGELMAKTTPQQIVDLAKTQFGSNMFNDSSDAASNAIVSNRIELNYVNLTGGIDQYFTSKDLNANREIVKSFFELLKSSNSEFAKTFKTQTLDELFAYIDASKITNLKD